MTDTMESLVLEHLRAIRATRTEHSERLSQIESLISNLEVIVAGMRQELAHRVGEVVDEHAGYNGLAARIDRIERRMDIHEG